MKKLFCVSVFIVASCVFLNSCNNEECSAEQLGNKQTSSLITVEAEQFKEKISDVLPRFEKFAEKHLTRGTTTLGVEEQEAKTLLSSLSSYSIQMLKSHGFSEKDWSEFETVDDPSFILASVIYLGLIDSNATKTSFPKIKTREEDGDGTCFDPYQILDCVLQATGVKIAMDALFGKCITKAIAWRLCKAAASKLAGPIAIAIALGDFSHCMGWLDFN